MRRWTRGALAATATLAGMIALAPVARAAGGTAFSAPKADTKATTGRTPAANPFAVLPPELLTCIAEQGGPIDQVAFSRVCRQWHTAAHKSPVFLHNLTVVRTQAQLDAALTNAQTSAILVIPDQNMTISHPPANPHAHIAIHDTKTSWQFLVMVWADIRVTASGTAVVYAYDSARVTAFGAAVVTANDSAKVIASGSARVRALDSAQVTASENAAVAVRSAGSAVVVRSSSVQLWVTWTTRTAVRPDKGVTPTSITLPSSELAGLMWEELAQPIR